MLFAGNALGARWSVDVVPPVALAFWRWTLAILILLPFTGAAIWRHRAALWREAPGLLLLGAFGMGVCGAPFYAGAATTSAANMGLIYGGAPVLIVVLERLVWREPVPPRRLAGILLCLAGEAVVFSRGDPASLAALRFTVGDFWVLAGATGWAIYSVLLRHRPSTVPVGARFPAIIAGGVVATLPFYLVEAVLVGNPPLEPRAAGLVLFLAVVPGVGAYGLYSRLVARIGAARASLMTYLIPLYAMALGWAVLHEPLAPFHAVGATLILGGVWFATREA